MEIELKANIGTEHVFCNGKMIPLIGGNSGKLTRISRASHFEQVAYKRGRVRIGT